MWIHRGDTGIAASEVPIGVIAYFLSASSTAPSALSTCTCNTQCLWPQLQHSAGSSRGGGSSGDRGGGVTVIACARASGLGGEGNGNDFTSSIPIDFICKTCILPSAAATLPLTAVFHHAVSPSAASPSAASHLCLPLLLLPPLCCLPLRPSLIAVQYSPCHQ